MIRVTAYIEAGDVEQDTYPHATDAAVDNHGTLRLYRDVLHPDTGQPVQRIIIASYPAGHWVRWWLAGEEADDDEFEEEHQAGPTATFDFTGHVIPMAH